MGSVKVTLTEDEVKTAIQEYLARKNLEPCGRITLFGWFAGGGAEVETRNCAPQYPTLRQRGPDLESAADDDVARATYEMVTRMFESSRNMRKWSDVLPGDRLKWLEEANRIVEASRGKGG